MWKEKLRIMKEKLQKPEEGNPKRKIENLVVFIVILVITLIMINTIWKGEKETPNNTQSNADKTLAQTTQIEQEEQDVTNIELEQRLESILQNMEGVGKVKVLLTYSESSQTVAMYNQDTTQNDTEETDQQGGSRKVTQSTVKKEVIYQEMNGEKVPVTQSVITPKIEGAIITAQGAKNSDIKTRIVQAIEAATGLATHKIQVFEMAT